MNQKPTTDKPTIIRRIARATPKFLRLPPVMAPIPLSIGAGSLLTEIAAPQIAGRTHVAFLVASTLLIVYAAFLLLLLSINSATHKSE